MVTDWRADIVDLGLSSTPWLRSKRTSPRSYNQDYRPPEFCLGLADLSDPATRAAGDIWAFGCAILVSMFRVSFSESGLSFFINGLQESSVLSVSGR